MRIKKTVVLLPAMYFHKHGAGLQFLHVIQYKTHEKICYCWK